MNENPSAIKNLLPREHGAYIILITSLLTGIARARAFTLDTGLTVLTVGFAYLSHAPLLQWMKRRNRDSANSTTFLYSLIGMGGAALCSIPLFLSLEYFWMFVAAGGAIYFTALLFSQDKRKRSILNEFIAFAGLCMASPLVYYAGIGKLDDTALTLWLFNILFFGSTVFTVKIRLKGKRYIAPTLAYFAAASAVLAAFANASLFPWIMLLAFVPLMAKIAYYIVRFEWFRSARLQTIGVVETFAAAAFAGLLIFL